MVQAAFKIEDEAPASGSFAQAARVDAHSERAVDLAHLTRQTMGDTMLEREILTLFVVQSQVYLLRLQAAETADEWRRAAHTIKGSARGIGAWKLADVAEAAEHLKGVPVGEPFRAATASMLDAVAATNAFVRELFGTQAA